MHLDYELIHCRKEQKALQEEDAELAQYSEKIQQSFSRMSSAPAYAELTWLTYDDMSRLSSCEENKDNKLIVIKAPPGTKMEIPDPKEVQAYFENLRGKQKAGSAEHEDETLRRERDIEDKPYQISLSSKTDEIMVYTVENDEADSSLPLPENRVLAGETKEQAESLSNMFGS